MVYVHHKKEPKSYYILCIQFIYYILCIYVFGFIYLLYTWYLYFLGCYDHIILLSWDTVLFFSGLYLIFTKICIPLTCESWNKESNFQLKLYLELVVKKAGLLSPEKNHFGAFMLSRLKDTHSKTKAAARKPLISKQWANPPLRAAEHMDEITWMQF